MSKPIPKSLHTVTVIIAAASIMREHMGEGEPVADAVRYALEVLGYANTPDTYNLSAAALKQMEKGL
jgi:hypothetical protein